MTNYRIEKDSLGEIKVDNKFYWGAQTQRAIINFSIGGELFSKEMINALLLIKKVAAEVNCSLGVLDKKIAKAIIDASNLVLTKDFTEHFPLKLWQVGQGTQANMNVNEVIANLANEKLGSKLGSNSPIHPNDHVNMGQSSNDTFPTAMHIATVLLINNSFIDSLELLYKTLLNKSELWKDIVKIGRTHLQDAIPMTLGQEFSGYATQIKSIIKQIKEVLNSLYLLAQGGTALGTGLNTHRDFALKFAKRISEITNYPFITATCKFSAVASNDALLNLSSILNSLATILMKIANDIRFLGSGPRCGIGELILPSNEPGSSIMPGKINPTQCDMISMVCAQVMGNHVTISISNSNGHFQLNVFKPVIIYNVIQSIRLLSDSCKSFTKKCLINLQPDKERISMFRESSLMLVTALSPYIGYDKSAKIAKKAYEKNITLKEAAIALGFLTEEEFDKYVNPLNMVNND